MTTSTFTHPPELVAPAGSFEALETVLDYGADAVYLGPRAFSLRAGSEAFGPEALDRASAIIHERGKKLYLTLNAALSQKDLKNALKWVSELKAGVADGAIISDPALIAPLTDKGVAVHLSTQVSTMNVEAAKFWKGQGVKRIVLARELSIPEIGEICRGADLEFEVFAHGALCMSISGRCMMSDYLAGRGGNKGECAQPCRWKFRVEGREKEGSFEIEEESGYSYLYNSKDLNSITLVGELLDAGVAALKIEGRNKGLHYAAVVVRTYREAIDHWKKVGALAFAAKKEWIEDLNGVSHRGYTTGFYKELAYGEGRQYYSDKFEQNRQLLGVVREVLPNGLAVVDVRNAFRKETLLCCYSPEKGEYAKEAPIVHLSALSGEELLTVAPNRVVLLKINCDISAGSLIRTPL